MVVTAHFYRYTSVNDYFHVDCTWRYWNIHIRPHLRVYFQPIAAAGAIEYLIIGHIRTRLARSWRQWEQEKEREREIYIIHKWKKKLAVALLTHLIMQMHIFRNDDGRFLYSKVNNKCRGILLLRRICILNNHSNNRSLIYITIIL